MFRRQLRRLKTPTGALLALVGFGAIALWIWSIIYNSSRSASVTLTPQVARLVGSVITIMSLVGALSFRGLYLPREEIELLFAAPLSRSDVIRYRLWTALGKSLFGSTFFGLVVMRSASVPAFGFIGAVVAMMTIPIAAQIVSLLAGDVENRWIQRLPKGALRTVNLVGAMVIIAVILFPMSRSGGHASGAAGLEFLKNIPANPVVGALTLPLWPWAAMITTKSPLQFVGLLPLCLAIWWLLYQTCVRIPIDYRELSLETSADVARRLARMRRGAAGAAGGAAEKSAAGWRVPWMFGRGPFGALAWRKTGTILRKARGTLMISGALVLVLVFATTFVFKGEGDSKISALGSSMMIAVGGTLYLCSGLRFDFREDLDRMDVVRSWPLAPWRVFLATILPEVVLVTSLLALAIVARTAITGSFPLEVLGILTLLAPAVLGWVAIDNAVFLFWPVRLTPGSEGMLQQAGRSLVLMALRFVATALVAGLVIGVAALAWYGRKWVGYSNVTAIVLASIAGVSVLAAECVFLIQIGGRALGRFDVARDR
jgi:hypothetical protein